MPNVAGSVLGSSSGSFISGGLQLVETDEDVLALIAASIVQMRTKLDVQVGHLERGKP